jgi:hypothetical protein
MLESKNVNQRLTGRTSSVAAELAVEEAIENSRLMGMRQKSSMSDIELKLLSIVAEMDMWIEKCLEEGLVNPSQNIQQ